MSDVRQIIGGLINKSQSIAIIENKKDLNIFIAGSTGELATKWIY